MLLEKIPHTRTTRVVSDVYSAIKAGKLVTQPEFQRRYWWSLKFQTGLINTIISGSVIVEMVTYVYRQKGYEEVVDGQQRLETIRRFVDGEFSLDKGVCHSQELANLTFDRLSEEIQNVIMSYPLQFCNVYSDEVSDDAKIQMFVNLNPKGSGTGIKHQEVRNCLYKGRFNNFLKKLAEEKQFHVAFNINEPHTRMLDVETVLAFLCHCDDQFKWWDQQKSLNHYMSDRSKEVEIMSDEDRRKLFDMWKQRFNHGLYSAIEIFGNRAFCERQTSRKGFFNRKIFLTLMKGLQSYSQPEVSFHKAELKNRIDSWIVNDLPCWQGLSSRSISASEYRDDKLKAVIDEIIYK